MNDNWERETIIRPQFVGYFSVKKEIRNTLITNDFLSRETNRNMWKHPTTYCIERLLLLRIRGKTKMFSICHFNVNTVKHNVIKYKTSYEKLTRICSYKTTESKYNTNKNIVQ